MESKAVTRRKFLGRTSAAVGLGVLSHPSFSARVFGANDRVVMGIIGSGGMGRGHMGRFGSRGADWAAVADVYEVNPRCGAGDRRRQGDRLSRPPEAARAERY